MIDSLGRRFRSAPIVPTREVGSQKGEAYRLVAQPEGGGEHRPVPEGDGRHERGEEGDKTISSKF